MNKPDMGAQFTPGPWTIVEKQSGPNGAAIVAVGNIRVGTISNKADKAIDQKWADAALIAAAPTLFGQLESAQTDLDLLRRAIEENDPKGQLLIRVTDLWKRNEAALAKARGEQ